MRHPFVACAPNADLLNGVCSTNAASVQPRASSSSKAWIAAAVVRVPLIVIMASFKLKLCATFTVRRNSGHQVPELMLGSFYRSFQ